MLPIRDMSDAQPEIWRKSFGGTVRIEHSASQSAAPLVNGVGNDPDQENLHSAGVFRRNPGLSFWTERPETSTVD